MNEKRFQLELRPPTHGWLPFRLVVDSIIIDAEASDAISDPLRQFADVAFALASSEALSHQVVLFDEPGIRYVRFTAAADDSVRVEIGEEIRESECVILSVVLSRALVSACICDALISLHHQLDDQPFRETDWPSQIELELVATARSRSKL